MSAAGIQLHPACRVRQEAFGLLFYDCRGPRLLFAETGSLLPADYFQNPRSRNELPDGLSQPQQQGLHQFINTLLERGFLREQ